MPLIGPGSPGHFIPCSMVEGAAGRFLVGSAPLLEVKCDALAYASVTNSSHPVRAYRPAVGAAFSACNYPVQSAKIDAFDRAEERLKAYKSNTSTGASEVVHSPPIILSFHAYPHPDVGCPSQSAT